MTVGAVGERGTVGPLSFTIPAGAVTVVTGDSGAGKTTLLQVLAGVQRPETGQVFVTGPAAQRTSRDDIDLAEIEPAAWRSILAWAGQGAAIQAGTIRDNLALGNPTADDATLRAALSAADATGFIDALPAGWDTELGEGGAGLSQGQRQRLALARAIARPSAVLLLDEPTASLDERTERRVLAGIRTAAVGRTVVLVTHRTAPLGLADHSIHLRPADLPAGELPADDVEALAVGPW
jgi:ABC-type bacteriocin/lantibiotic exporter with double-glycine peptidase domain